jgi:phenylacetic acid degradation protein
MPSYEIEGVVPVVDPTAYVHPTAVLIGDVVVGPACYVGPFASLRGDFGRVQLRAGSNFQDSCVFHTFPGTVAVVEEDGHVGHGAVLHGCRIARGALIGMNAVVMDGAVVGEQAFVSAHSLVRAGFVVPPRTLAAGAPAKMLRDLTEAELAWKANGTRTYQELTRRSLATLREVTPLTALEPDRPHLSTDASAAVPLDEYRRQAGAISEETGKSHR